MPQTRRRVRLLRHHGRGPRGRRSKPLPIAGRCRSLAPVTIDFIKESGFKYVTWWDGCPSSSDTRGVLHQCASNRKEMKRIKIEIDEYLNNWVRSLTDRAALQIGESREFA